MTPHNTSANKVVFKVATVLIAATLLTYLGVIFRYRPWVDCDLMEGVFSLNNYLYGLGFHQVFNVGADYVIHQEILSYWAPGEYVYSWQIARLLQMNLSGGIIFTNIFFLATGLIGYYYLLRHFGFSNTIIAFSIFVLVVQRFFNGILLKMNGVDIYLIVFAVLTILVYEKYHAATRTRTRFWLLFSFFILFLSGLFAKNSFLLFVISSSAFYFVFYFIKLWKTRTSGRFISKLITISLPGIVGVASALIFHFSLYARSRIPFDQKYHATALELSPLKILNIFIKPTVQTLGSLFTFDAFLFRIPSPDNSYFAYLTDFTWQGILASVIILIPLLWAIIGYVRNNNRSLFTWLALSVTLFYLLFFCAAIIRQSEVYAEDRLFLPMMLLLMPVYTTAMLYGKNVYRLPMLLFFGISVAFSALAIPNTIKYYHKSRVVTRNDMISGFQIHSETDDFDQLEKLGKNLTSHFPANNLLITKSTTQFFLVHASLPSISLELDVLNNIDSFIRANHDFLAQNKLNYVSVVAPAGKPLQTGNQTVALQQTYGPYTLYVLAVPKK
jgi:hypothetical protein